MDALEQFLAQARQHHEQGDRRGLSRVLKQAIPNRIDYYRECRTLGRDAEFSDLLCKALLLELDEEIYNIFDTKTLLNRPASVMISKTSGLAGIAYWVNDNYALSGGEDYELVFTVPLSEYEKLLTIEEISIIGHTCPKGEGYNLVTKDGNEFELKAQGWVNFNGKDE